MDGIADLVSVIAAHLREWEPGPAFVELAIFKTANPQIIARELDGFCERVLGARVARGLFHQSSIGCVTGVELADGRLVVIKIHQPSRPRESLIEIGRLQNHLAAKGLFAPRIIVGPLPLGQGHAVVEPFIDVGAKPNTRNSANRRSLARGLRQIVVACEPFVSSTSLGSTALHAPAASLWPTPHSKLFDFEATAHGAEWIDNIAAAARKRMQPAGVRVIGHADWREEHVRFAEGEPVAAFDWDSLTCDFEPMLIGSVAHAFCADWSGDDIRQAPTREQALGFIEDYQTARTCPFSPEEQRVARASLVYACAYTARCGHALANDQREITGSFQHLLWTQGMRLLEE